MLLRQGIRCPRCPLRDAVPWRSVGSECSGRPAARLGSRLQLIAGNGLPVAAHRQAGRPCSREVTACQPEPSLGSSAARHAAPRDQDCSGPGGQASPGWRTPSPGRALLGGPCSFSSLVTQPQTLRDLSLPLLGLQPPPPLSQPLASQQHLQNLQPHVGVALLCHLLCEVALLQSIHPAPISPAMANPPGRAGGQDPRTAVSPAPNQGSRGSAQASPGAPPPLVTCLRAAPPLGKEVSRQGSSSMVGVRS